MYYIITRVVTVTVTPLIVSQRALLYYRYIYSSSCLRSSMVSANFDKIVSFGTPAIKADNYLTTEKKVYRIVKKAVL
jgi:hypothetical protein